MPTLLTYYKCSKHPSVAGRFRDCHSALLCSLDAWTLDTQFVSRECHGSAYWEVFRGMTPRRQSPHPSGVTRPWYRLHSGPHHRGLQHRISYFYSRTVNKPSLEIK